MYLDNYKNLTNIDISDIVIQKMNEMYNEKYEKMKCNLKYNDIII
jgi:hypothetical protein